MGGLQDAAPVRCVVGFGILMAMVGIAAVDAADSQGVPPSRVARLAQGINVTGWLIYGGRGTPPLSERLSDKDLDLIQAIGFKHLRIPIDWSRIHDSNSADLLNAECVRRLDEAAEMLAKRGLAMIVDLHHIRLEGEQSNYSGPLQSDPKFVDMFITFWGNLAKRLSQHNPEYLFLEPMNEPTFVGMTDKWLPIQERLVSEIRKNAPQHTILATSAQWSNLSTFLKLEPLSDPNIVYNFHFYEPFPFTHQGATWSSDWVKPLRKVAYPSSPESVESAIAAVDNETAKRNLRQYGKERWDAARIEARIAEAAEWAKKRGVAVTCNEFGVYRNYSPPADAVQWHKDLCSAFARHNIGWSKWELEGGFGFFTRENGKLVADPALTRAMGLNADAAR